MKSIWLKKTMLAGAMISLLLTMLFAVKVMLADWAYFRAEKSLAAFRAEPNQQHVEHLIAADEAIQRALNTWQDNSEYLSLAAQTGVWQGHLLATSTGSPEIEAQYYEQALELLRQAIRLSPANARTWALLAEYKSHAGQRDEEWHNAKEKALELGGADIQLVNRMLAL